jgi:hypothetical protein
MLEEAIAWGMKHGFCDEAFAAEYRAQAHKPAKVREFVSVMALYAKCLYPATLDNEEARRQNAMLVNDGVVPSFFAPFLGVN